MRERAVQQTEVLPLPRHVIGMGRGGGGTAFRTQPISLD
jgi:hypothetical protein